MVLVDVRKMERVTASTLQVVGRRTKTPLVKCFALCEAWRVTGMFKLRMLAALSL